MKRGIITQASIFDVNDGICNFRGNVSKDDILFYSLYWDKILIPDNNAISFRVPEQQELLNAGILERPRINFRFFSTNNLTPLLEETFKIAKERRLNDSSTDWVIHQMSEHTFVPDGNSITKNSLRFELLNSLPSPKGDVDISEVLDFKSKRRDEFIEFHNYLDQLYDEILNSPDQILERNRAIDKLKIAITNIDRVTKEKFSSTKKYNTSLEFNLKANDILNAVKDAALFEMLTGGSSMGLLAASSALMSCFKLKLSRTKTSSLIEDNDKLAFLTAASTNEII